MVVVIALVDDFHWTEPIPVSELPKLLETLSTYCEGKQIDG